MLMENSLASATNLSWFVALRTGPSKDLELCGGKENDRVGFMGENGENGEDGLEMSSFCFAIWVGFRTRGAPAVVDSSVASLAELPSCTATDQTDNKKKYKKKALTKRGVDEGFVRSTQGIIHLTSSTLYQAIQASECFKA